MRDAPSITGATRLYAIVGDPIVQVRSPQVFTPRFAADGIDAVMIPVHVPRERFDAVMPGVLGMANLDGVLVTVPFKARMLAFVHDVGPTARAVGAVNALRREPDGTWTGDMFDGAGFVRGLEQKGARISGRHVVQFGAGGAGCAIAYALAQAGVASLQVVDPDARRAHALVDLVRAAFPALPVKATTRREPGTDMIVNASPVGMRPDDGLPGDIGTLQPGDVVGDVVIVDPPTALVAAARRAGCICADGRDMHAGEVDMLAAFLTARRGP